MSVLPITQLGYTLGVRRDKNIYGRGERGQENPFAESRGRTRMAGTRVIDLFTTQQDYMATPYARGSNMPDRFKETRGLDLSNQFTNTLGIPIEKEEDD